MERADSNISYMGIAQNMKRLSKDPDYKVGAIIVDPINNVIVSSGSNHFPDGCDDKFQWTKDKLNPLNDKNSYVVHAEANAILKRSGDIRGCVMYTSLAPCNECAKLIILSDIASVYHLDDRKDDVRFQEGRKMLENAEIPLQKV